MNTYFVEVELDSSERTFSSSLYNILEIDTFNQTQKTGDYNVLCCGSVKNIN